MLQIMRHKFPRLSTLAQVRSEVCLRLKSENQMSKRHWERIMNKVQAGRLPETINLQEVRAYMQDCLLESKITEQDWDEFQLAVRFYLSSTAPQPAGGAVYRDKVSLQQDSVQVRIAAVGFLTA